MLKRRDHYQIINNPLPLPKQSRTHIIAKIFRKLKIKYNSDQCNYTSLLIDNLIFNKNTHLVSIFKDHMIYDYKDEFLKREYSLKESIERVPKFASFYKNYLKFFCCPLFKDLYLNDQIQEHGKDRAELFYNQNFKGKKEEDELNRAEEIGDEESKEKAIINCGTIFNTSVKDNIDNNPIITQSNSLIKKYIDKEDYIEESMTLNQDTALNDSGLLVRYSNEQSLLSLMRHLKRKSNRESPRMKGKNILQNQFVSPKNNIKCKSNIISYTRMCNEQLSKANALKYIHKFNTKSQLTIKEEPSNTKNSKAKTKTRSRNLSNKIDFKTDNPNSKKSFIKTQNMENIINRITNQVNSISHSKNVYSIDYSSNNNHSKKKIPSMYSQNNKAKSLCNLTKNNRGSSNKSLFPLNNIDSSIKNLKHSIHNSNDLMKLTLALLIDNHCSNNNINKSIKNSSSNSKFPGASVNSKHIQNVNININNHININNNNVHLLDTLSSKQIPSKLLKNDRVEVNIQSNLKKLFNGVNTNSNNANTSTKIKTGPSRNKEAGLSLGTKSDNRSDNSNLQGTLQNSLWNNTIINKNKKIIFTSCSNFDKLKQKHYSSIKRDDNDNRANNNYNNHKAKLSTKTISVMPKPNISQLFSNQVIQRVNHPIKYSHAMSLNKLTKKKS